MSRGEGMFVKDRNSSSFEVGQHVRVKRSFRSPYSGRAGVLIGISLDDSYGTHLVHFSDGVEFRYTPDELRLLPDEFGISAEKQLAS
jgi:hypothetical protein